MKEKEENRSERREHQSNFLSFSSLLFFFFFSHCQTNTFNVCRLMVILPNPSMNRQLFNEVFKQISSKIDQFKIFHPPPQAHLKVTK